nr:unnamed protein product [Callosobruchus chinensis]
MRCRTKIQLPFVSQKIQVSLRLKNASEEKPMFQTERKSNLAS